MSLSKPIKAGVIGVIAGLSLMIIGACTPVPVQNNSTTTEQTVVGLWHVTSLIDENGNNLADDNSNITLSMTDEGKGILLMDNKPFGSDMSWTLKDGTVELSMPGEKGVPATLEGDTMSFSDHGISMICEKIK